MKFIVGQIVNHRTFGEGKVINVEERKGPYGNRYSDIVTVEFPEMEREIVDYEYVPSYESPNGLGFDRVVRKKVNYCDFTEISLEQNLVKEEE